MTEPTMIERVARILCDQDYGDPDAVIQGQGAIEGTTYLGWEAYASNARAVIAALRMTDALSPVLIAGRCTVPDWNAMIDAALKDGP